jgi:hypothetical protein
VYNFKEISSVAAKTSFSTQASFNSHIRKKTAVKYTFKKNTR